MDAGAIAAISIGLAIIFGGMFAAILAGIWISGREQ
jgi:hypothetical protein